LPVPAEPTLTVITLYSEIQIERRSCADLGDGSIASDAGGNKMPCSVDPVERVVGDDVTE